MNNTNKKSLGYIAGCIFATICIGCVASVVIAATIKLLMWMF